MLKYIAKRIGLALITIFTVASASFRVFLIPDLSPPCSCATHICLYIYEKVFQ